jgi:hypothetical protein
MREEIVIRLSRRWIFTGIAVVIVGVGTLLVSESLRAQDVQEKYSQKFNIVDKSGHLGITSSSDGQYVYVLGQNGVLVSNDYGKMGSWSQTVKLK